ncbi:CoA ester lyase [Iodidimonas sp. SYSU 1G8]|uniref:HpcH/HpaI aldolase/citrate lyase family protein n=1 Tax=Iodidimonas sp. SYSU 1G8 TaxID=3133967 RepID=UPI0031FEF116
MAATFRPRRSVLYMPGSNARAQEKAKSIPADAIILDLEDAVAPDAKAAARETVCNSVIGGGYGGREMIIRCNGLDTPWGVEDVKAACAAQPDAILIPKVESAEMVHELESLMDASGALATTAIWCMIETPRGVLRVQEIAAASSRVAALVMGTSDLVKDVHARHTPLRLPMLTSLSLCILAARAEGLAILDGVYLDLQDAGGFRDACVQGLEFGFDGKTLIHPSQVDPCNEVYAPDAAEVDLSRRIIEAFAEAEKEGKGVVVVDGKLVENLHVENAKRVVALAEAIHNLQEASA